MTKPDTPLPIRIYRMVGTVFRPLTRPYLQRRVDRGKEDETRLGERSGITNIPRPEGPLIWIHAASVGETTAVLPLAVRLLQDSPSKYILLTTGTVTSAAMVEQRAVPNLIHQYAPIDIAACVRAFLGHWKPDLALYVESELWPTMLEMLDEKNIPVVMVNGRMSDRSFRRWQSAPQTIRHLLGRFDLCIAQSEQDGARLSQLGVPNLMVSGNLKFDAPPPPVDLVALSDFNLRVGSRPLWVAVSTHPGEEDMMADAHDIARRNMPDLLTVIVPRHPERGDDITKNLNRRDFRIAQRSLNEPLEDDIDIYLADTLGELGLFCTAGHAVFMGGSLVSHGGQNPIEPIKLGAAVIHGPHIHNFEAIYTALDRAAAAIVVKDSLELADAIRQMLAKPASRHRIARQSLEIVTRLTGALEFTLKALRPFYPGKV